MTHSASGRRSGSAPGRQNRSEQPGDRPEPVRIAVDLLGGDNAPAVVVDGALRACRADPDLRLLLVGTQGVSDEAVGVLVGASVLVVDRAVGMSDPAALGADPQTSIGAAMHALGDGQVDAVVSAGSSGAIVAAAVLALGRLPGVRRPALAAVLPAANGPLVLLDVGAGLQAGPVDLIQHAVLGCQYAEQAAGINDPRVGLLSVGSEPGKGDRLRRLTDAALRSNQLLGRYAGLVEGHDVVTGARADVVVTDGFTGNVLLKGLEAALATLPEPAGARIAEAAGPRAAALLGVAGRVVVCHGAAGAEDIASGIGLAARLVRGQPAIGPDRVPALPSDPPSPADPAPPSGPAPLAEVQV